MRNKKAKGTAGENELIHLFWSVENWVCVRVAGSGSNKYPSPDILASNGDRKLVIEVKVINSIKKYFSKKQILDLELFGTKFGAEPWVGIKFEHNEWYFLPISELNLTKNQNYNISLIEIKKKGFKFKELITPYLKNSIL